MLDEEKSPVKFPAVSAVENRSARVIVRAMLTAQTRSANNLPEDVFFCFFVIVACYFPPFCAITYIAMKKEQKVFLKGGFFYDIKTAF